VSNGRTDGCEQGAVERGVAGCRDERSVAIGMEGLEDRALCPQRAANEPSFAWSCELVVEGPQAP
jgi:hypothetical protein